jgi:ADP-ribose pyrophosphatase YjhB (NUDIX family)
MLDLLHRSEIDDFWSLPGGRTRLFESARDALRREMRAELADSLPETVGG